MHSRNPPNAGNQRTNGDRIDLVVKRFNLDDTPPLQTPIDPNAQISKVQSPADEKQHGDMRNVPYCEAMGSLMYATIGTRPDITFAVTLLSQYLKNPGHTHWEQAKRVIRYLKGTRDHELTFGSAGGIEGFTDANWGNDIDDRHSICRYVFTLNGGAISWVLALHDGDDLLDGGGLSHNCCSCACR